MLNGIENNWNLFESSMSGFFGQSKSAVIDNKFRQELVSKSRVLLQKVPLAKAIIDVLNRGVIGSGLHLKDSNDVLEALSTLHLLEASNSLDFYQMQQQVWYTTLTCGECFLIRNKSEDQPYSNWIVMEPDRVFTPPMITMNPEGQTFYKGHLVVDGIEYKNNGTPLAIHVCKNPYTANISIKNNWQRVFFEDKSGIPNVIHVKLIERPEYPRGLPILSPLIENLYSLYAFQQAQVQMAIVQSCNAFVIKTNETDKSLNPLQALSQADLNSPLTCTSSSETEHKHEPSKDFTIVPPNNRDILGLTSTANYVRPGSSIHLGIGEEIQNLSTDAPGSNLVEFYNLIVNQCAASLGIPPAVLTNVFDVSFSSSKCSVAQWQYTVSKYSKMFIESCLKPLYRVFLIESGDTPKDALMKSVHSVWMREDPNCLLDESRSASFVKDCLEMGLMTKDEACIRLLGHSLDVESKSIVSDI